jgi:hypothetical protein
LARQKLVVSDGVRGQVREVAQGEGSSLVGGGSIEQRKARAPLVADLLLRAHFLGEDSVGGDVAVDEEAAVAGDQRGDAGRDQRELSQQVGGELNMGDRAPGPGVGSREENSQSGEQNQETTLTGAHESSPRSRGY